MDWSLKLPVQNVGNLLAERDGILSFFVTTGKGRKFHPASLDNSSSDPAACRAVRIKVKPHLVGKPPSNAS